MISESSTVTSFGFTCFLGFRQSRKPYLGSLPFPAPVAYLHHTAMDKAKWLLGYKNLKRWTSVQKVSCVQFAVRECRLFEFKRFIHSPVKLEMMAVATESCLQDELCITIKLKMNTFCKLFISLLVRYF